MSPTPDEADADQIEFCSRLATVANAVPAGETQTLRLWALGFWVGGPYTKTCDGPGRAGQTACAWWVDHSSNEFWDINAGMAEACLVGGRDTGVVGREIYFASGVVKFDSVPSLSQGVEAEIEYPGESEDRDGQPYIFVEIRFMRSR